MVQMHDNIVGIDAAIFMHPKVWKASGHVDGFNDPMIDNKDIFPIIAPAYSTVIGGFIGWLAAIKINNTMEKTEDDQPVA